MNMQIDQTLEKLSIAEKRALGEALIASSESEASAPLITDAQRAELRERLAYHRAHPDEAGITVAQIRAKLLTSVH